MLNTIFRGVFDADAQAASMISIGDFILCLVVSLLVGLLLAGTYTVKNRYTKSFLMTLAILPAVVCVVIMMVNGNIGTGVAVAGTFSLVRFRSVPGTAKEICAIFLAMCTGLIAGMGYLGYAVLFALVLSGITVVYNCFDFGSKKQEERYKVLHITIPEDLDYTGVFDDVLTEYTQNHVLEQVKTTNMGSLFKLTYNIVLKNSEAEKELIDKLRCRNGNLEISISQKETVTYEL